MIKANSCGDGANCSVAVLDSPRLPDPYQRVTSGLFMLRHWSRHPDLSREEVCTKGPGWREEGRRRFYLCHAWRKRNDQWPRTVQQWDWSRILKHELNMLGNGTPCFYGHLAGRVRNVKSAGKWAYLDASYFGCFHLTFKSICLPVGFHHRK